MAKHDQYNLTFTKALLANGITKRFACSAISSNQYEPLTFINSLQQSEIQYFIDNITLASQGTTYDPNFYLQDGTEAFLIDFTELDFNIEGVMINMLDLQQLLQEWMTYLNS